MPAVLRWILSVMGSLGVPTSRILQVLRRRRYVGAPPVCEPDQPSLEMRGTAFPGDARTYLLLPFEVRPGTGRLEVTYDWRDVQPAFPANPITQTVFDLGLWDEKGYRASEGFRGWSGSRHKKVFIRAETAEKGYYPGPINPGVWYVELGFAAVGPTGAEWTVKVRSSSGPTGEAPKPDPVDGGHVANPNPGWYHGDFHMHAWHSTPKGPTPERFVEWARLAHLDFLPVTEYVVGVHWSEYGRIQRDNPDLLIWPGREIITYFGHMQSIGETPGFIEYRHGFEDVHVRRIQQEVRAARALFQINHPTTFDGAIFRRFCRGCAFDLEGEIDWDEVDTIEVLSGPAVVKKRLLRGGYVEIENPFMGSAIELWERLLTRGHRITAVCGSDAKQGKGLGSCATAVLAERLSRPALIEAIRDGRAYVRALGVAASPQLEMTATSRDAQTGTFGCRLNLEDDEPAEVKVVVKGGAGQSLRVIRNGEELHTLAVDADHFEHVFAAHRATEEGPLGTWYRVETFDEQCRTTIGNPIFLGPRHPIERPSEVPGRPPTDRMRRNLTAARSLRSMPYGK